MQTTISTSPVPYEEAITHMAMLMEAVRPPSADPVWVWYLEHPALYTAGSSAKTGDLLASDQLPVYQTGRGGQYTYHGPGQLIVYCMVNLRVVDLDVRAYIKVLEHWILAVLKRYGVDGFLRAERVGVWVINPQTKAEDKIAALGVRVSQGVTMHGLSFNWAPDLSHYTGIVPCGLPQFGVTSLKKLGIKTTFQELVCAFQDTTPQIFLQKASSSMKS
jgi:lipoyl(octanoyl) transferase